MKVKLVNLSKGVNKNGKTVYFTKLRRTERPGYINHELYAQSKTNEGISLSSFLGGIERQLGIDEPMPRFDDLVSYYMEDENLSLAKAQNKAIKVIKEEIMRLIANETIFNVRYEDRVNSKTGAIFQNQLTTYPEIIIPTVNDDDAIEDDEDEPTTDESVEDFE